MIGISLGDALGLFPGMEMLMQKVMTPPPPPPPEKKSSTGFTFCPPGMQPNPQWSAIPEEARGQAAASGIQACIPAAGATGDCTITYGSLKLKCNQGDFTRAYSRARKSATKSGKVRHVSLAVGGETIRIPVHPKGAAGAAAAGAGYTPGGGVIPATMGPNGTFSCPPGYVVARNAQGQVVCAPPDVAAQARAQAGRGRRSRRDAYRSRHGRRGRRGFDGLGQYAPEMTGLGQYVPEMTGLGFANEPFVYDDYMDMREDTARYEAALSRESHYGQPIKIPPVGIRTQASGIALRPPIVPDWMALRLPPVRHNYGFPGSYQGGRQTMRVPGPPSKAGMLGLAAAFGGGRF